LHPWVADGGDGLQVWRVAASVLNKQSQTIARGVPSWGLGERLTASHCKKPSRYEVLHRILELDSFS